MTMHVRPPAAFGSAPEPVLHANGVRIDRAFAVGLKPPPRISVADWAAEHRRFGEDAPFPGRWNRERAPYLEEIMDCASPHHPAAEVPVMKCAQSGGSAAGENFIGYVADVSPGPMMYVGPTISAAKDWLAEKFWPMVEATPRLSPHRTAGAIMPKRQRDGAGTTALRVRFRKGGWMLIAGANSAATLRQHSIRFAIEDDLDQFPDDLDNQGSPERMLSARLTTFTRQGIAKRLKISTPTNKGASKISQAYEVSDQRRFYLVCPQCASRFDPIWTDLRWPDGQPELAVLQTPCCGYPAAHWEKAGMSRPDGWLATVEIEGEKPPRVLDETAFQAWRSREIPGRAPGFHITGIITAFMTWASLCTDFVKAQGNASELRAWTNLSLGEPFEVRGAAPDHELLKALVEQDWGRSRRLPVGALATTIGVDVQGDGVYYELLAWGPDAESWSIEAAFVPGSTDVEGDGAWALLEQIVRRPVIYPAGQALKVDQVCVDAGYNTAAAEAFCRGHANRLAVFGRAGWSLPVLGRAQAMRHETQGRKAGQASKRAEDRAFLVGTYGVKLTLYGYLRRTLEIAEAERQGERLEGRGRCHFGPELAADFFEQLTAETIETKTVNGYPRREWKALASRPNHFLDCRVYNHAAAERLKLETLTDQEWEALRLERYAEPKGQGELFEGLVTPAERQALRTPATAPAAAPPQAARPGEGDWIQTEGEWL